MDDFLQFMKTESGWLATTLVGAAICAGIGGAYGSKLLDSGHLFNGPYDNKGMNVPELWGLLLETQVFPFAFILGGAAAGHLARHTLLPAAARAIGHVALAAACCVACWLSWNTTFGAGGNLLHCGVFVCGTKALDVNSHWRGSDSANGFAYKVNFGAVVFVVSFVWGAFQLVLCARAAVQLIQGTASGATDNSSYVACPENDDNATKLSVNSGAGPSSLASLVDKESQEFNPDLALAGGRTARAPLAPTPLRKAAAAAVPFALLLALLLACGIVPNSFSTMTAGGLVARADQAYGKYGNVDDVYPEQHSSQPPVLRTRFWNWAVTEAPTPQPTPKPTISNQPTISTLPTPVPSTSVSPTSAKNSPLPTAAATPAVEKHLFVLNMYPDVLIFYLFLAFIGGVACAAHLSPTLRKVLHHRVPLLTNAAGGPKWWWNWIGAPPWSITIGGAITFSAFLGALAAFAYYWAGVHWFEGSAQSTSGKSDAEYAARTVGQVANLVMGLLLLPVAKNSILTSAFGIAWEQVLWMHTWLGGLFLGLGLAHMFLWWAVYSQYHIFSDSMDTSQFYYPEIYSPAGIYGTGDYDKYAGKSIMPAEIFRVPMQYPCNANANRCSATPHADNWTIQLIFVSFMIALLAMGGFARYSVRRRNFELFYYAHHAYVGLFISVLWHAASAWYYVGGGLALWFVDRCLRARNRARRWELTALDALGDDTTGLMLKPADGAPFEFQCGQYIFLNVPELGRWEWHPFTISSAPSDGVVTCHIKQAPRGPATFTGQLHALALARRAPGGVAVGVDGPYGEWLDHARYSRLLLVAGGIGVTPIVSIFRELWLLARRGACDCAEVHLVWTIRLCEVLEPFALALAAAAADDLGGRFKISLFVDGEPVGGKTAHAGVPIIAGRPNFANIVPALGEKTASEQEGGGAIPHVFVCGPPGMTAMVDTLCLTNNISFHKEVFAY